MKAFDRSFIASCGRVTLTRRFSSKGYTVKADKKNPETGVYTRTFTQHYNDDEYQKAMRVAHEKYEVVLQDSLAYTRQCVAATG